MFQLILCVFSLIPSVTYVVQKTWCGHLLCGLAIVCRLFIICNLNLVDH